MDKEGLIYTATASRESSGRGLLELVEAVRAGTDWLPPGESWWFGWNELELALPSELADSAALPTTWPAIHIFSPKIELRWLQRGFTQQAVLLTEQEVPSAIALWHDVDPIIYQARPCKRYLWGDRLSMGGDVVRATVQFPREMNYGVSGEQSIREPAHETLMVEALAYYDAEARLQTVRYQALTYATPSAPRVYTQG